ncbi:MAG: oligosaccharide flippase family protein [Candidatus Thermoplasmatota archaeon]|nr:oligosaccharide flippase family protein [Candidatus Thermoplasmatota archaeon]
MRTLIQGLKNLSFLTLGNIISIVISTIGFLFIANMLGKEDYGKLSAAISYVSIFSLLTLSQMSKVLIRSGSRDPKKIGSLLERTFGVKTAFVLIAIMVALFLLLFTPYSLELKIIVLIIIPDLFYYGFESYLTSIFMITNRMYFIAIFQIINKFAFVVITISLLVLGLGVIHIAVALVVINLSILFITYIVTRKIAGYKLTFKFIWDWKLMKPTIIFSILLFCGFVGTRIDVLMISLLRPVSDVGIYAVVERLVDPLSVLKNLIAISFFPLIVKLFKEQRPGAKELAIMAGGFGSIALAGAFFLAIISGPLIDVLFPDYQESKAIFQVLVFYQAIGFMTLPFGLFLQASDNEMSLLKISWVPPVLNIGLNIIFLKYFGLIGIAYSTLMVYSIYLGLSIWLTWSRLLKGKGKKSIS